MEMDVTVWAKGFKNTLRKYSFGNTISSVLRFQSWQVRVRWWNLFANQLRCSKTIKNQLFWLSQLLIMLIYHSFHKNDDLQQLLLLVGLQSHSEIIHPLCGYFLYDIFVCMCIKRFTMDQKKKCQLSSWEKQPVILMLTHRRKAWAIVTHMASQVKIVPCKFAIIASVSEPWKST